MNRLEVIHSSFKWYQMHFIILLIFTVLGAIGTNVFLGNDAEKFNIILETIIPKLNQLSIQKIDLFKYILFNRIGLFLLIWMAGFVVFTKQLDYLFTAYFGFLASSLFSISIISKGIKAYLMVLLLYMPHYMIYIPVYILLIYCNMNFSDKMHRGKKGIKNITLNRQSILSYVVVMVLVVLSVVIGAFLESYVNIDLLRWYLSISGFK